MKKCSLVKPNGGWGFLPGGSRVWNPISGCLNLSLGEPCSSPSGDPYCYMEAACRRYGLLPHYQFHEDRLHEPSGLRNPSIITVCTSGDLFSWLNIVDRYIADLNAIRHEINYTRHQYVFLTKFPQNLNNWPMTWGERCMMGTTVTCKEDFWRLQELQKATNKTEKRWLMLEPFFFNQTHQNGDDIELLKAFLEQAGTGFLNWIVVGPLNGKGQKEWEPAYKDYLRLAKAAKNHGIPIYFKPECWRSIPMSYKMVEEFPREYPKHWREAS